MPGYIRPEPNVDQYGYLCRTSAVARTCRRCGVDYQIALRLHKYIANGYKVFTMMNDRLFHSLKNFPLECVLLVIDKFARCHLDMIVKNSAACFYTMLKNQYFKTVENEKTVTTLYVGNIPVDKTIDDIYYTFGEVTERLTLVKMHPDFKDPKKNRGYCLLTYESHFYAAYAKAILKRLESCWGRRIQVDWSFAPEDRTEPNKSVYVANFAPYVNSHHLGKRFEPYGIIVSVNMKDDGRYAFVNFIEPEEAIAAMLSLNGTIHDGLKMVVKLAVAPRKGQTKKQRPPFSDQSRWFYGQPH